ncbi:MAG TPA: hypothetical protein VIK72_16035 [Clostridiaceae bacterium]
MKTTKIIFIFWISLMFLVTFTCSLVYIVSQQSIRLGANQLPAQLAVETSTKLQDIESVKDAIPSEKVDITKSLNTFVMVYDINKKLIASSAISSGSSIMYPTGILDNVTQKNEARVTWQPERGLRYATVAIKYDGGYIVAARSLSETEKLIDTIGKLVIAAWLACAVFLGIGVMIIYRFFVKGYKVRNL